MEVVQPLSVALVHDYLVHARGGEQVLLAMHLLYPDAPVHTVIGDTVGMPSAFQDIDLRPSALSRLPGASRYFRALLPLYPLALRSLRLGSPDLVLSSSSAAVKNVRAPGRAVHVCYCHTPIRALWQEYGRTLKEEIQHPRIRAALTPVLWRLRMWDRDGSRHVHRFIANSALTAKRIRLYYGRDSVVLHPPIDISRFKIAPGPGAYYLVVSHLVPYKRVDLAVRACSERSLPLKVAGVGHELETLRAIAGPTVEFLGRVDDEHLADLYSGAIALLFPGEEDFGLVPLEAMASGRPVIAFAGGGALETVADGASGVLFAEQTVVGLLAGIDRSETITWSPASLREHARRFDLPRFQQQLDAIVRDAVARGPEYDWG